MKINEAHIPLAAELVAHARDKLIAAGTVDRAALALAFFTCGMDMLRTIDGDKNFRGALRHFADLVDARDKPDPSQIN